MTQQCHISIKFGLSLAKAYTMQIISREMTLGLHHDRNQHFMCDLKSNIQTILYGAASTAFMKINTDL